MSARRNRARGFTLLEVMVATVIMAVAVTTLLAALSTSLRVGARLTEADRATLLARQKMDELLTAPLLPKNVALEGAFDPALTGGVTAGWRARATPFEAPPHAGAGMPVLVRVELEVWWMNGGGRHAFPLEAFRRDKLRPEEVPPGGLP